MNKPKILIVEDDKAIRNLITTTLETQNYKFHAASNGQSAIFETASYSPDIIILDLGLPDMDGIEVIHKIRTWSRVPIVVVSARSEDRDKIEALDAGADDYLTKPFNVGELLARLRVVLRRTRNNDIRFQKEESVFINGGLVIDYVSGCVKVDGTEIHLTPIEYKLICLLSKNAGKVLTHKFILNEVWVNAVSSDMLSLRVYMTTLRKKIEPVPSQPIYIQTHVGVGYRMLRVSCQK